VLLDAFHLGLELPVVPGGALERLCRLEHRRFVAERLLEGWLPATEAAMRHGPSGLPFKEKKSTLRVNHTLVPFGELPDQEKIKDHDLVQATPRILTLTAQWKRDRRAAGA